jgi:hypothetical protein
MAYTITTPRLGFQGIHDNSLVQNHPLGTIVRAEDPTYGEGEFIYLRNTASTGVGTWCTYNHDDNSHTTLAANAIGPVAVSMVASGNNQYAWWQIKGKAVGLALAGFVDNANVYATATAGSVDDAIVAGDRIQCCKGASAVGTPSAGLAEFEIDRPFINDALAD